MAASCELRINRELINSNFDGYKLSLDKLSVYRVGVDNGFDVAELGDDQFSYHHTQLFGVHNHLVVDLWQKNSLYYLDKDWNVRKITGQDLTVTCSSSVYSIPEASKQQLVPCRFNAGLKFLAPDLAVVCDGAGLVHVIDTGDRASETDQWKTLLSKSISDDSQPCYLTDCVEVKIADGYRVECLVVTVVESTPEEKDKFRSQYLTVLEWMTFSSVDRKTWSVDRTRQLVSRRTFRYAVIDKSGNTISIAGDAKFVFTRDSEVPVVSDEEKEEASEIRPPEYTWNQTEEDVSIQFTVPSEVNKTDIYLTVKPTHIDFGLKNNRELLKGQLYDKVDKDASVYTMEGQRVEVTLGKASPSMWPLVVEGDTRGELVMDQTEVAAIHERLSHLTSDQWNTDPDKQEKPYNVQQLEECDMYPDENFMLMSLDGDSHNIVNKFNLGGHQWLFNAPLDKSESPAICLRHDVDGVLWKKDTTSNSGTAWSHYSTFNAFGYVQASKTQRKFSSCPPDCSYAVICDGSKHIYVYRQCVPVENSLRNRKSGQQVNNVAKQQVVSLETVDKIVGMVAFNDRLFVATEKLIHMIKV